MQGLISTWNALPLIKRFVLLAAIAATTIAFSMLARTASAPEMAFLYSGLEPETAGDVISALEQMNVTMDVRGDTIYVPTKKRDFVRMALARDGLPRQGQAGYELLEELNGFSTSSDVFDVAYWRAIEGELARTILATPGIQAARVHIAKQQNATFRRNRSEPKAVVTVTMARGVLKPQQANSVRYLVASAVADLSAEQVAVIDAERGVILSPGKIHDAYKATTGAETREKAIEEDVLNILEARVGPGNARVQISLEIDTEREAVSERVFDPNGRVISGKETTEMSEKSTGANSGAVTVASNLPEGDTGSGSQNATERTQTDEVVKYSISEVRREREKSPGAIKKISAAVLINYTESETVDGELELVARDPSEIEDLSELVANAIGLNETRGDTLTVKSLPFKAIPSDGVFVEESMISSFLSKNLMTIIQIGILSVVSIILGLFVVKPLLSIRPLPVPEAIQAPIAAGAPSQERLVEESDPLSALRNLANERTDDTALLIKSWLDEEERVA
ncbi:MAG: flagellar M-ring protein FliF [Marinicaulis sp.]|nr:flagellar M-ring protein FliF [Marinicaulis sp.]NNE41833.1 flagellar M-ring protein FliF [Marinicaulis sp.]NNL90313.1 flagellar M-ring protein FliF [Marinicaulis sp.]